VVGEVADVLDEIVDLVQRVAPVRLLAGAQDVLQVV
jgi:hypothetical protein